MHKITRKSFIRDKLMNYDDEKYISNLKITYKDTIWTWNGNKILLVTMMTTTS